VPRDVILVIEDSAIDQKIISRVFQKGNEPYELHFAATGEEALARMRTGHYAAVLLDYSLPGMSGLEILKSAAQSGLTSVPSVMLTGMADIRVAVEAMKLGAYDYVLKTAGADYAEVLPSVIRRAIERHNLLKEKERLEREVHEYATNLERIVQERTAQLRATTNFLNNIVESSTEFGIVAFDLRGNVLLWNSGAQNMFGYPKEEVEGKKSFAVFLNPEDVPLRRVASIRRTVTSEGVWQGELKMLRRDGSVCQVLAVLTQIHDENRQPKGILSLLKDVTHTRKLEEELARYTRDLEKLVEERTAELRTKVAEILQAKAAMEKQAEELRETSERLREMNTQLQVQKTFFDGILSAMNDCVRVVDDRGEIKYTNRRCRDWECPGGEKSPSHIFSPGAQRCRECACSEAIRAGKSYQSDVKVGNKTFSVVASPLREIDGSVKSAVEVIRDITERRRSEEEKQRLREQLAQAQKIEALGTLAGGIAHEFNNINAAVIGYIDFTLQTEELTERARRNLEIVRTSAARAASLTKNLLAFSRRDIGDKRPVNLRDVVDGVLKVTEKEFTSEGIELAVRHSMSAPPVLGDASMLESVVMNLVINARHAMLKSPVKKLTVETGVEKGRPFIRVRDSGCGIPREHLPRVFEPFFTTKGALVGGEVYDGKARGTGLGLSVCHSIVERHGGEIALRSQVGKGTTFTVYLPPAPTGRVPRRRLEDGKKKEVSRILVVDDEETITDLLVQILDRGGYQADGFTNPKEALNVLQHGQYFLSFIDLQMPEIDGEEFMGRINRLPAKSRPLKVILTGRLDAAQKDYGELDVFGTLPKPFTTQQVFEIVEKGRAQKLPRPAKTEDAADGA
jgi:PAS domain S-box-containing protein